MSKKLRIQDFKDVFGYNTCKIEIHVVELEAGENESVTVLNYGNQYEGRQLSKIPHNTPIMVQVHLKQDGYYELEDDCLMIIDEGELKEYKREYDHQTTFEAAPVEENNIDQHFEEMKKELDQHKTIRLKRWTIYRNHVTGLYFVYYKRDLRPSEIYYLPQTWNVLTAILKVDEKYNKEILSELVPVEEAPVEEPPAKKETKKTIIKKILTKANPRRDRSKSIKVNVHKNFANALEKEANLELEKYSLYEIPAEYYRGGYTFDVLIYEVIGKDSWGNNDYELFDAIYFYPNQETADN